MLSIGRQYDQQERYLDLHAQKQVKKAHNAQKQVKKAHNWEKTSYASHSDLVLNFTTYGVCLFRILVQYIRAVHSST